jgi:hypothetical protein
MNTAEGYARLVHQMWTGVPSATVQQHVWGQLLTHGQCAIGANWTRSRELSRRFRSVPGACYANARAIATSHVGDGLMYCEGFATPPSICTVEHAWVVDTVNKEIIDPTWAMVDDLPVETSPPHYFGAVIPVEFVYRAHVKLGRRALIVPMWAVFLDQQDTLGVHAFSRTKRGRQIRIDNRRNHAPSG